MSLLEQAKSIRIKKKSVKNVFNKEVVEVFVAWLNREITTGQVVGSVKKYVPAMLSGQVGPVSATAIREGIEKGWVKLEMK